MKVELVEKGVKSPLSREELLKLAALVKRKVRGKGRRVSLLVVDDSEISKMNHRFFKRQGPTNVISFSYLDDYNAKGYVGDIIISVERAEEEALESGMKPSDRFAQLFIHGLLHIYGYDHEEDEERKAMEALEEEVFKEFKGERGG